MRILYLPIIEPGENHDVALKNKRGLLNALVNAGHMVEQLDYLAMAPDERLGWMRQIIPSSELLISQLHGADIFTPAEIRELRALNPSMRWVNWSGDSWAHSLTAQPILDMIREFDLQLVAAPDVLPIYAEQGIRAGFWQIAYESPVGELPDMPEYDIVFLGNVISDKRREMLKWLRTLPYKVGIYGDWEGSDGRCTYDFGAGEALYKKAKIAIADNTYPDQRNYMSNRPIQVMMAHGALLLHQHVPNMEAVSDGWMNGFHYRQWTDLNSLREGIDYWMNIPRDDEFRQTIIDAAYTHASTHHTYDTRVEQLFKMLEAVEA